MSEQPKNTDKPADAASATRSVEEAKAPTDSQVVILPPETIKQAAAAGATLQIVIAATHHSGPLPAPATLKAYNEIVPGLPQTIIGEFQKESAHRRRTQTLGQVGAIGIATLSIVGGVWLGYYLQSALAALAVIGPVCGVVGTAQLLEFRLKAR